MKQLSYRIGPLSVVIPCFGLVRAKTFRHARVLAVGCRGELSAVPRQGASRRRFQGEAVECLPRVRVGR